MVQITTWWDPALESAIKAVKKARKCSARILMKHLNVSYCRAQFLVGILQKHGIVSRSGSGDTYKVTKNRS